MFGSFQFSFAVDWLNSGVWSNVTLRLPAVHRVFFVFCPTLSRWITSWRHRFKLSAVYDDASAASGCKITWILKLSGFPFPHMFLSLFVIVFQHSLNQPPQSDCLDFVLCILFSYTPPFPSSRKRGVLPKSTFLFVTFAEADFLSWNFSLCPSLAFSTHCTCIKKYKLWFV